jgi:hypothetical protein
MEDPICVAMPLNRRVRVEESSLRGSRWEFPIIGWCIQELVRLYDDDDEEDTWNL